MKAIRVHAFGPPDVLRVEDAATPDPAEGQVLVAVEAAGVSYGDVIVRSGRYPFPRPYVPGLEVGGRVVAVGSGADPALVGSRVVAATVGMRGGYAELALADAAGVHAVPDGLPIDRAVAVFQAGALAIGMLDAIGLRPGDSVLVTAAAGRIGSLLVQRARTLGAGVVIGVVGGERKAAAARDFGADVVVDYTGADWPERVREALGGRGADIVLDAVGGEVAQQALAATADGGGRFGLYGFTSGRWAELDDLTIGRRGLSVVGVLGIVFARPAREQRADAALALAEAAAGRLVPAVHAGYPLERAAEAHAAVEGRATVGAVLITP
ncbi:NADPH2:quinone reductase [Actinacidiphila yanglinensis]|uniref:NADPH2:quinone reductase n=1 Tax=Actinacidiphila yanglinensis TaxID=310779 RepID=A0A1H6CW34_9ACTN|nr:zinc-binding dehydrogenase [Actinacidiphila yanglinensis]SEG77134.1 NADPH2:quinone reductase [Actinacidiphila yanglinensis]